VTPDRPLPTAVVAALAAVSGAAFVLVAVLCSPALAAVTALIAACALVPVRVPWGGSVTVVGVPLVAVVALVPHVDAAATLAAALPGAALLLLLRRPRIDAVHAIARFAGSAAGALAGVLAVDALVVGGVPVLAAAIGASIGVVVGDLVVDRYAPGRAERVEVRSALPVHLTLACAGILVAVAVDAVGVAMAAVAAFPLLITRFSFARYAGATDTLDQTVQALGLVPELAGLAPLGHSERSAHYARALSRALGLNRAATTRVVTATRLHHIGGVPLDESIDPADATPDELASHGARILRQSGFSPDVADLLADARADVLDADAPSIEAAVVRVAAVFDELVGDDLAAADRGVALVSGAARDPHSRRAAAALLDLAATRPTFVADAIAAGERFREAAVGLDLEAVTANRGGPGELLPFTRRT
jgi:hypothetical protein